MRLIATYVFYADVFFLQNLLIKVTALYLALYVNKLNYKVAPIKVLTAGIFGTFLEILILMWGQNFSFFVSVVNLVEIPAIMFFFLGKAWKDWINVTVSAWFLVLVINGVVEAGWNYFGESGQFIMLVLLSCILVWIGIKWLLEKQKIQKGIYPVELYFKEKRVICRGFYDSGNTLKDPYTGVGVHIISRKIGEKLETLGEMAVLIPYSSLGNEIGLMKVYYLDKIEIYGRKEVIGQFHIAVGIAEDSLFLGKDYDLILNENVW